MRSPSSSLSPGEGVANALMRRVSRSLRGSLLSHVDCESSDGREQPWVASAALASEDMLPELAQRPWVRA